MNRNHQISTVEQGQVVLRGPKQIKIAILTPRRSPLFCYTEDARAGFTKPNARIAKPFFALEFAGSPEDRYLRSVQSRNQFRDQVLQIASDARHPIHAEVDANMLPAGHAKTLQYSSLQCR